MTVSIKAFRAACLAAAAFHTGFACLPANAQSAAASTYQLPAQDLATTLRTISRQGGREIIFADDAARGRRAPAIAGHLTAEEAVRAAIAGSGLIVEERAGALVVHASPQVENAAPAEPGNITVTGTRIRGAEGPSPVIVTTRRSLEEQGIANLTGFARTIPQNFTGGQNPGVAGGGDQGGQNNINNSTTLNLRGLGPDATLTLINGHRLPYDALNQGVDISMVPLAAIDRVEIIADGASALYGSDAVAGVANILLRPDYDGVQASARIGGSTEGGNFQQQYGLVAGKRWTTGGFMAVVDYSEATPIQADERSYTDKLDPSQMLSLRSSQASAVLTGHQQLAPGVTLQLDGEYSDRRSEKATAYFVTSDAATNGLINKPEVRSWAITPELRVALAPDWEASLEVTHGDSRTDIRSRRFFNGVETGGRLIYDNALTNVEASAEGRLAHLPGGDARLAFGGGYRWFSLDINTSTTSGGVTRVTRDGTERRESLFAYGELSLPVVGPDNRMPFLEALRLSAAVRYENYKGIDEVATPKLGLVYQPHRDVTVRFSWGRSFKIPTLEQVNEVQEGSLFAASLFSPQPTPPLPAGSTVLLLSGGSPDLRAERATSSTLSVEFRPHFAEGLRVEASYFDVDYRDRIASPITGILSSLANPLYAQFVVRSPGQQQVNDLVAGLALGLDNQSGQAFDPAQVAAIVDSSLRNTAREHDRGVDLALDYRAQLGTDSQLLVGVAGSYLDADRQITSNQPTTPRAGVIFTPPHWRARGSVSWENREIQVAAALNWVDGTLDNRFPVTAEIHAFTTLDLSGSFRPAVDHGPLRGLELRLSVQNLLNEEPDAIRTSDPAGIPYDSTNQSPIGRFVSFSVTRQW